MMTPKSTQLFIMQLVTFVSFIAMSLPSPVLAPFFLNNSAYHDIFLMHVSSQAVASFGYGAYPLGVFLGGLLLGILSDKLNKKNIFIVTLIAASAMQLLSSYCVITHNTVLLIVTRLFTGLFEGNIVIARSVVAQLCPIESERCSAFGKLNAALTIGWIVGPFLGAALTNNLSYMYLPFLASSVICFATSMMVLFCFKPVPVSLPSAVQGHKVINFSRSFVLLLITASFILTMGVDCFYQFMPIYLAGALHYDPLKIAIATIITACFSCLTNIFITSKLANRYRPIDIILVGSVTLCGGLLILGLPYTPIPLYGILPLVGFSIAITTTTLSSTISMTTPDSSQGKLMGLMLSSRSFGAALICFVLSAFLTYSYKLPFVVAAVLIFSSVFMIKELLKWSGKYSKTSEIPIIN